MSEKSFSNRGGHRTGAGRKAGSGSYGEATAAMRIPLSLLPVVKAWLAGRIKGPPPDAQRSAASLQPQRKDRKSVV